MIIWIVIAGLFLWLGIISFLLFKTITNYNRLTRGVTEKTLSEVLNQLLVSQELSKKELTEVELQLKDQKAHLQLVIQKVGLVRFNPFSDTGGDQSFILAFLDAEGNGVIMTSLYARTGVRWYIKAVKKGKGIEHELSDEETDAIKKAMKGTKV